MFSSNIFNTLFVFPILNLLIVFYKIVLLFKLPGSIGLAIIALTVFIRLIFNPFFKGQIETAQKMQGLKPHLDKLTKKHKKNPKKLQKEQMLLYKKHGVNPAGGCLGLIVQMPIFIGLYLTLSMLLMNGTQAKVVSQINKALYSPLLKIQEIDPWFFGFNLAVSPAQAKQLHYYLIPLITAGLQYFQVKFSSPSSPINDKKGLEKKEKKKEKGGSEDFQKAMQTQMKFIFPLMLGWFSYTLPIGLSLYWNIFSIFSIMQYWEKKVKN